MTVELNHAVDYAHNNAEKFLANLQSFLTIPSIATLPEHHNDILRAADWLADQMKNIAIEHVKVFNPPVNPVVYGDWMGAGPDKPTILLYGHYDVQPVDPLDLWETPPFESQVRGDSLFARGASDMKGQILVLLSAIESIMQTGKLPVNIKFIIEGEEEIGSPHIESFIHEHRSLLACDAALNLDASMAGVNQPSITYALRGLCYCELLVEGPDHDLHSGTFGGTVQNPANALCQLIAGMHDDKGRITLPGFYDSVLPLDPEEKAEINRSAPSDVDILNQTGSPKLWGEDGFTSIERMGARPTLDVNGMISGFTGNGGKTIIPSWARAKISMRLVPNQDPLVVQEQLRQYLVEHAPDTIRWTLLPFGGGGACLTKRTSSFTNAFAKAQKETWGVDPVFKREGGSVPIVALMQNILGADSLLSGFGLPDDHIHSPNEKLHLPTWFQGIDTVIRFLYNLE